MLMKNWELVQLMNSLKNFTTKISNFNSLGAGEQIKYFVYYIQIEKNHHFVCPRDIQACFEELHINVYSNIPRYLKNHSKKKKGQKQQFLSKDKGYILLANVREDISLQYGVNIEIIGSDVLYPLSIFDNTRGYLIDFSKEASECYEQGLYNSCLLMLRKITETLIVDLYESRSLQSKITNPKGDYFQLNMLIGCVTSETTWKLSKTPKTHLPKLKLYADSSAHSRRFRARKTDVDGIKEDIRIIFEEIVTLIDYSNFKI